MGEESDRVEGLVARYRAGEEAALGEILARTESALRDRLLRDFPPALRRRTSPEDVLQEAWIVAVRRLGRFQDRGEGSFLAWVGRIVDLKLREAERRHRGALRRAVGREVTRGARPDTNRFEGSRSTPSEVAMGKELGTRISRALADLPADYREVLRLVQKEGLALGDAAAAMGRSRDALRKLYARALSCLAERLDSPARAPLPPDPGAPEA